MGRMPTFTNDAIDFWPEVTHSIDGADGQSCEILLATIESVRVVVMSQDEVIIRNYQPDDYPQFCDLWQATDLGGAHGGDNHFVI